MKKTISLICVMLCIVLLLPSCSSDKKVSKKALDKLEEGMTYEEVVELFGFEGFEVYSLGDFYYWQINDKEYAAIYFELEHEDGYYSNADKVIVKRTDGSLYKIESFVTDDQVEKITKGMTKGEVKKLLGSSGIASSSGLHSYWAMSENKILDVYFSSEESVTSEEDKPVAEVTIVTRVIE
ncbi:MAG: outer membrane protein assembly factor BamE [Ruminococcaceae bacterium]|nr:outer membrane protein assembly factor BamE [Oscillospiraceae bacterium]